MRAKEAAAGGAPCGQLLQRTGGCIQIIGINEEAVRDNDCPESYFRTLFYLKSVKRIDSRPNYLVLHLADTEAGHPPM